MAAPAFSLAISAAMYSAAVSSVFSVSVFSGERISACGSSIGETSGIEGVSLFSACASSFLFSSTKDTGLLISVDCVSVTSVFSSIFTSAGAGITSVLTS